ncbi:CotH kinase family protein [Urbifossiella limnaea]|uniref:Inner spore coat protein H n=1 Tax=Urbifossiella limnaea TaxID=2528023 RepID=A0A517Y0B9_9BACT|nr:CotH kinase family protein [Urbifossiella limnaea]QDU23204.1 Inner spore coat protein H [Urbifossiella limnaea]
MTRPCLVAALVLAAPAAADEPPRRPAHLAVVPVTVTLSAAEYTAMQPRGGLAGFGPRQPVPPPADPTREAHKNNFGTDLPWATGDVTIGGETFTGVGVRYKGNGTILDASFTAQKSFRVNLGRGGGTGRYHGSKTINLHCGITDPSGYREAFGYAVYRAAKVPAPATTFAEVRLTVPGRHAAELLGLYTLTEEVDAAFLRAHYGTADGLLLKPEGVRDLEFRGDDWTRYATAYRPKREPTAAEARRLVTFSRLLHTADDAAFRREAEAYLDVDAYLRFLAVTSFVANVDSFFALGHNYYLYLHPATGRLHFVPWDLDRAFANHPLFGTAEQKMDLSLTKPYPGKHRLTERVLALPGVGERYRALLRDLAGTAFAKERLLKELDAAEAALKEPLARDAAAARARKEGDTTAGLQLMYGKPPNLREFVGRRTASVAAQLAGTSAGYVPAGGFGPFGPPPAKKE